METNVIQSPENVDLTIYGQVNQVNKISFKRNPNPSLSVRSYQFYGIYGLLLNLFTNCWILRSSSLLLLLFQIISAKRGVTRKNGEKIVNISVTVVNMDVAMIQRVYVVVIQAIWEKHAISVRFIFQFYYKVNNNSKNPDGANNLSFISKLFFRERISPTTGIKQIKNVIKKNLWSS